MVACPFHLGSLLALSYAAAPGTQHLTFKPSQSLVAIYYIGLNSLVSFITDNLYSFIKY